MLWHNFLKKHPLRFRRQYIIGNYIVDFYCHKAKLAIELDGSGHYEPDAQAYDRRRTAYLESQGVTVLRFANSEVLEQFRNVCERIHMQTQNRFPRGEAVERMRD